MTAQNRPTFSIWFFIRKSKVLKNGEVSIGMRITVNGASCEIMTKRSVAAGKWNTRKEEVKGNDLKAQEINRYLGTLKAKVLQIHRRMEMDGAEITAREVCDIYYGRDKPRDKTIVEVYEYHNKNFESLVGIDYSAGTLKRYRSSLSRLKQFIKHEYQTEDLPLTKIDGGFISKLELYLKVHCKCQHNAAMKHLKNLKKVIGVAIANNWLERDPFYGFRFRYEEVDVGFLSKKELEALISKELPVERLACVRDVFVFCSFTGLSFSDVKNLRYEHFVRDNDGSIWIRKGREKTGKVFNVPVLSTAMKIVEKYRDHPKCVGDGTVLPVISNQRMNAYLKEIASLCGIDKKLTTHIARHTAATVVFLGNKMALENVSKILGHTNIRTTQRYARVLDSAIMRDMADVEAAFGCE